MKGIRPLNFVSLYKIPIRSRRLPKKGMSKIVFACRQFIPKLLLALNQEHANFTWLPYRNFVYKILKEGEYFYQDLEQNAWFNLNGLELCVFACDSINHKSVGGRKWMYVKKVCIEKSNNIHR